MSVCFQGISLPDSLSREPRLKVLRRVGSLLPKREAMESVIQEGFAVVLVVMRCRLKERAQCSHDSASALIGNKAKQKCGVKKKRAQNKLYMSACVS